MRRTHEAPPASKSYARSNAVQRPELQSRTACLAAGKALREKVPHELHAVWRRPIKSRDPIAILKKSSEGRLQDLVPIRYGRMSRSPFTFLRGSAAQMAYDLATLPTTQLRVQACGDCHVLNFGLFATPERKLIFDMNDFDETLPAPWEWDVKRLAASFAVAARDVGHSDVNARDAAVECARSYRQHLRDFSKMSPLDVWYDNMDEKRMLALAPDAEGRARQKGYYTKARGRVGEYLVPEISGVVGGHHRLLDQPPVLFHLPE